VLDLLRHHRRLLLVVGQSDQQLHQHDLLSVRQAKFRLPTLFHIEPFEARGQRLGHGMWDVVFVKTA
jgi:hypothetical protein